jgi:hypothetical protein
LGFSSLCLTNGLVWVNGGGGLQVDFAVAFNSDSPIALGQERDALRDGQVAHDDAAVNEARDFGKTALLGGYKSAMSADNVIIAGYFERGLYAEFPDAVAKVNERLVG